MITNQVPSRVRRMLTPRLSILYRPADKQWSYCHHPFLCEYRGELHAIWSNGERDEDDLRQRVLHCVSKDGFDFGRHEILFNAPDDHVYTACGLYDSGEALVAYAGSYRYAAENVENGRYKVINDLHRDVTLLAKTTANGVDWGEPIDLQLPITPIFGPAPLASGRLIMMGNITYPISDRKDGLTGWRMTGLPPFPWPDCVDDSEGFMRHTGLREDNAFLCESSFYQTDDGVIHVLLRSAERILYHSESRDDGETWSKPEPTEFTNCNTKFHCGRLPDGRFYIVGSPDPACARCPIVITTSDDGVVWDREYVIDGRFRPLRHQGKYKGGIYAYPHSVIVGDRMYIACSVNKEDIHVYSFPLSQLA